MAGKKLTNYPGDVHIYEGRNPPSYFYKIDIKCAYCGTGPHKSRCPNCGAAKPT